MREIKFRAWEKINHKIIQVSALSLDPRNGGSDGECGLHIGLAETDYNLMQYTGLHDKDGKEIYEGDIIRCIAELVRLLTGIPTGEKRTELLKIIYLEHEARFTFEQIKGSYAAGYIDTFKLRQEHLTKFNYEVIGNIYENPELLEVK
jgi:uncharacterized phage protein (TIGR01671 family)